MADTCYEEVMEICVPSSYFLRSIGVAFDVGGARCKVAFKKRKQSIASKTSDDSVTISLGCFPRHKLNEALDYIKKNADTLDSTSDGRQRQLLITGVFFSQKFATDVETQLNLSTGSAVYINEFSMQWNAIHVLLKNLSDKDAFYPMPPTQWTASQESAEKMEPFEPPFLILSYGSATGITMISKTGEATLVNGSPEGGISLLALSKQLVGTDDFTEFMSLAARGNISKVSSTAEVCTQEMDAAEYFKQFPPQAVVHAYGNVLKPDYSANPEDMARALLMNAIQHIASMTMWTALAKDCRNVYLCGGVFEHELPRDLFCYMFEGLAVHHGKTVMKCRALKYASFIPVLGAVFDDCVSNNNQVTRV